LRLGAPLLSLLRLPCHSSGFAVIGEHPVVIASVLGKGMEIFGVLLFYRIDKHRHGEQPITGTVCIAQTRHHRLRQPPATVIFIGFLARYSCRQIRPQASGWNVDAAKVLFNRIADRSPLGGLCDITGKAAVERQHHTARLTPVEQLYVPPIEGKVMYGGFFWHVE
jgi:hypothetical protein